MQSRRRQASSRHGGARTVWLRSCPGSERPGATGHGWQQRSAAAGSATSRHGPWYVAVRPREAGSLTGLGQPSPRRQCPALRSPQSREVVKSVHGISFSNRLCVQGHRGTSGTRAPHPAVGVPRPVPAMGSLRVMCSWPGSLHQEAQPRPARGYGCDSVGPNSPPISRSTTSSLARAWVSNIRTALGLICISPAISASDIRSTRDLRITSR